MSKAAGLTGYSSVAMRRRASSLILDEVQSRDFVRNFIGGRIPHARSLEMGLFVFDVPRDVFRATYVGYGFATCLGIAATIRSQKSGQGAVVMSHLGGNGDISSWEHPYMSNNPKVELWDGIAATVTSITEVFEALGSSSLHVTVLVPSVQDGHNRPVPANSEPLRRLGKFLSGAFGPSVKAMIDVVPYLEERDGDLGTHNASLIVDVNGKTWNHVTHATGSQHPLEGKAFGVRPTWSPTELERHPPRVLD